MKGLYSFFAIILALAWPAAAGAGTIKVGVTIAQTGPAALLGIPQKKTIPFLPQEIAGEKFEYIVLDDGTGPTKAVANARKLATEENADVIVGSSTSPSPLALVEVASEIKIPLISLAASAKTEPLQQRPLSYGERDRVRGVAL